MEKCIAFYVSFLWFKCIYLLFCDKKKIEILLSVRLVLEQVMGIPSKLLRYSYRPIDELKMSYISSQAVINHGEIFFKHFTFVGDFFSQRIH